jgi:hypothetical protein
MLNRIVADPAARSRYPGTPAELLIELTPDGIDQVPVQEPAGGTGCRSSS